MSILQKHSVRTAQWKLCVLVIKTSQLINNREIIAFCSQIHIKHVNTLCGQNVELLNVKLVVRGVLISHYPDQEENKLQQPNSGFIKHISHKAQYTT
jgi:hypothetical protein